MKKKILFIISNLESGGVSKSMSSLLNVIDVTSYDISLFILNPKGIFMNSLPQEVEIIKDIRTSLLFNPFPNCLFSLCKHGYYMFSVLRFIQAIVGLIDKSLGAIFLSRLISPINKEYDLIVDYNGQHQLYYMIDKLKAKKKITYFHSDYSLWSYYFAADNKYYKKVDYIFTISNTCVDSLKKWFPHASNKIALMENITSLSLLEKMSDQELLDINFENNAIRLVSVGHVIDTKGSHWAIEAVHILKERGLNLHWIFVGHVSNPVRYNKMVDYWNLHNNITFIGTTSNPYPYIKWADIFVHPSQFEGKSIALDEAKLLCKPIVVTNFSTVNDQFIDGVNATICEMNPFAIAEAIESLAKDNLLRRDYINYLEEHKTDNISEINKLYKLLD